MTNAKTATERLRELLDERGVKWSEWKDPDTTAWFDGSHAVRAEEYDGQLLVERIMTPEQAIAATLGQEDTYTREDVEGAFVSGYSLGSLPVGSDPRWDENKQTVDEHMAKLGWVRAATLGDSDATATRQGVGTCVNISNTPSGFLCSECGWGDFDEPSHLLTTAKFTDNDGGPNYCPNCGRKVVDE